MSALNPLLYGKDDTEKIVGVIPFKEDSVLYFVRRQDGTVRQYESEAWSMFLTTTAGAEEAMKHQAPEWNRGTHRVIELATHEFAYYDRVILSKNSRSNYQLRESIKAKDISFRTLGSRAAQWLLQTGKTLMKGMNIHKIRRMQVDIETIAPNGGFSQASRKEDQIVIIAISDNHGFKKVLHTGQTARDDKTYQRCPDEKQMLIELIRVILMRDPDVIEGHNFYGFDMPYIMDRCELHEVEFVVGRNNKKPRVRRDAEAKFAEQKLKFDEYTIEGRTIIDTMFLVKAYDSQKRVLPSHGLKDCAKYFGVSREGRVYVEGNKITETWLQDPDTLLEYALDDVDETRSLSDKLLPATFAMCQMVPNTFQRVHVGGVGSAINLLFTREYLQQRTAIPKPAPADQQFGGLVGLCKTGRIPKMLYIDVESLYPSIMLIFKVQPKSDSLKLFQKLLTILTELRLKVKAQMNEHEKGSPAHVILDAEQTAYKVIINSFYGVLGSKDFAWNDVSEADRVATTGQVILWRMIDVTTKLGCELVECDTDGILTIAPPDFDMADAKKFVKEQVEPKMPKGIKLDLDGKFEWMLSYKAKNYALLGYDDKISFKGGAWKNRGIEAFGRNFMKGALGDLLRGHWEKVRESHSAVRECILTKSMPLKDFMVRKNLKMDLKEYIALKAGGQTPIAAQYEVWSRQPNRYAPGDTIYYWVAAHNRKAKAVKIAKDAKHVDLYELGKENSGHYLKRFETIVKKFDVFFDDWSFGTLFDTKSSEAAPSLFGNEEIDYSRIKCPVVDVMDVESLQKTMERNQAHYRKIYS